jgi:hypothetical protein
LTETYRTAKNEAIAAAKAANDYVTAERNQAIAAASASRITSSSIYNI